MTTDTYKETGVNRPSIPKDPDAVLDYSFDWTDWMDGVTDTIDSVVITASGVAVDSIVPSGDVVTVWVSGGTPGEVATVTCSVTTNSTPARKDDRTIYLIVKER